MRKWIIPVLLISRLALAGGPSIGQVVEMVNEGKLAQADSLMDAYLKTHAADHRVYFIQALIQVKKGRYGQAKAAIGNAIGLNGDKAEYHRLAGHIYEHIGDNAAAVTAWKTCLVKSNDAKLKEEARNHLGFLEKE